MFCGARRWISGEILTVLLANNGQIAAPRGTPIIEYFRHGFIRSNLHSHSNSTDVVFFEPGEKHWHGAAPDSAMSHIALQENVDGKNVDWLEHVTDEQYSGASPSAER